MLLDAAILYLFTTHLVLREKVESSLLVLESLHPRNPEAIAIETSTQELLTSSIVALILAVCATVACIGLISFIAWSVRCLRKSRRFAVALSADLEARARRDAVRIVDISSQGCRVLSAEPIPAGTPAILAAEGVVLPEAQVVWSGGGAAGLRFSAPLDVDVLKRFAPQRRGR
jgi:hypothetical protein